MMRFVFITQHPFPSGKEIRIKKFVEYLNSHRIAVTVIAPGSTALLNYDRDLCECKSPRGLFAPLIRAAWPLNPLSVCWILFSMFGVRAEALWGVSLKTALVAL